MAYNYTEESSLVVKQDNINEININEISKTSDLEIQDMIDLYDISMVDTTYDKTKKVGITLPISLIKQTDELRGDVKRSSAHTLIIADSTSMPEIKSESIHLVVTSPPYWNLKKYGEGGLGLNHAYAKYLYGIQSVLKEVKRVMAPGRFVAINVGTAVSNDGMKPINADVVRMMEDLNFTFKKEIIWVKPKGTQGLWQRGVTKFLRREPYPCYFSLNIMHEYILIFQNEGQMRIPLETKCRLSEAFIKEVSWSVWEMGVSYTKGHPAPFPDELPSRLIQLYTVAGETVLDPFGGSGTTMKVARNLKRNSILYEINTEYIELIKKNVGWSSLDPNTSYEIKIRKSITS